MFSFRASFLNIHLPGWLEFFVLCFFLWLVVGMEGRHVVMGGGFLVVRPPHGKG